MAQVASGHGPDLRVALVLAVWYAGFGLTNSGIRYGFAALYARSGKPWLARAASAVLLAGAFLLLSTVPAVTMAIGRVASGGDTGALLSAAAWLLIGLLVAATGVSHAEALVARAIADGDATLKKAKRGWLESRRPTEEPDSFRLNGAGAFGWTFLMNRRKQRLKQVLVSGVVFVIAAIVARYAREWTPAVAGVLALLLLLASAGVVLPGPAVADGRLLPLSLRRIAAWKILTTALGVASGITPAWAIAVLTQAGDRELLLVGSFCLLPFCLLAGVLSWERIPDVETPGARFRRLGSRAVATVGVAAALAWWQPGLSGAALAAGWLLLGSLLISWHGVRRLELTLRPTTRRASSGAY